MITKSACLAAIALLFICQFSNAQDDNNSFQKVDDSAVAKPKSNLTYEYQYMNDDHTEGIEKSYLYGKLKTEIYFKEKGKFQFAKSYSTNTGKLMKTDTILDFTRLVGTTTTYYANGKPKEMEHRDDSSSVDCYQAFFQNGNRRIIIHYKNGKRYGNTTEYNPNGTVKETGSYINDKREGTFRFYDVRGHLLTTRRFRGDKIVK
jgi:antitoxin component YwqK of YwqJK toxin-antitoxin module